MVPSLSNLTFKLEQLDPNINYAWEDLHHHHHDEPIEKKYKIDYSREIGRTHTAVIRNCTERGTGKRFALRSVMKANVEDVQTAKREAAALALLNHSNILRVYETFEDENYFHIVTESFRGRELRHMVEQKYQNELSFSEKEAMEVVWQLVQAVVYCHEKNLVHRNLKLESVHFNESKKKKQKALDIKIVDFSRSTTHDATQDEPLTEVVGTSSCVPPEVLNGAYTNSCDLWSIGVITHLLLTGKVPFANFSEIRSQEPVVFHPEDWKNISPVAQDFVKSLLEKDASVRPSAAQAALHEWLQKDSRTNIDSNNKNENLSLLKTIKKSIQRKERGRVLPNNW